jgi:hypothetical protein
MRQLKADLRGLSAPDVLLKARTMLTCITGNPLFPNPVPSMADFGAACAALERSIMETANGGNRLEYSIKQGRLDSVRDMVKALVGYVSAVAQGDEAIARSAGLEQRRPSTRITSLASPSGLRATTGVHEGTIMLRWKPVHGARMYRVFISKGDIREESAWQQLTLTTNSRYMATGLLHLQSYAFRVVAIGAHTESPMSQLATGLSIGRKAA